MFASDVTHFDTDPWALRYAAAINHCFTPDYVLRDDITSDRLFVRKNDDPQVKLSRVPKHGFS